MARRKYNFQVDHINIYDSFKWYVRPMKQSYHVCHDTYFLSLRCLFHISFLKSCPSLSLAKGIVSTFFFTKIDTIRLAPLYLFPIVPPNASMSIHIYNSLHSLLTQGLTSPFHILPV